MGTQTTGIAGGGVRGLKRLAAVLGIAAALLLGQTVVDGDPASAATIDDTVAEVEGLRACCQA